MGKLEKLIVLAVLFAAAVVLAVSLNRGKDEVEAADPLSGARTLLDEGSAPEASPFAAPLSGESSVPATHSTVTGTSALVAPGEKAPSLLLHAGNERAGAERASGELDSTVTPKTEPVAGLTSSLRVEPASDPSSPILLERQGLRPSFMDEYMLYTVAEGDSWSSLALRFYQDGRFTRNLHLANEDLSELVPGKDILVPVFDLLAVDSAGDVAAEPEAPSTEARGAPLAARPADQAPTKPAALPARPASAGGLVYEVRAGDTLSDISLAALGSATRWKELLDLNAGLLKKPEDLRVGMKLTLPAGAQTPTKPTAKPEPKKPQPQAKTASTEKAAEPTAATATKKRKVL